MKKVPGSYQVGIIRPDTQDSQRHIVECSPEHRGLALHVPWGGQNKRRPHFVTSKKLSKAFSEVS